MNDKWMALESGFSRYSRIQRNNNVVLVLHIATWPFKVGRKSHFKRQCARMS